METPELNPPALTPRPQSLGMPSDPTVHLRRGATLELQVTDLAFCGNALSKVNGLVMFVENALPVDRVIGTIYRRRRQYAEAWAVKSLESSSGRFVAPCSHLPICGGF